MATDEKALVNETSNLVVLKTYDIAHLAHLDRAKLADEGIESFVQDDNIVSVLPYLSNAVGYIKLLVSESRVVRAREILSVNEFSSFDNAFEGKLEAQAACPNCGSTDIIQRNSL